MGMSVLTVLEIYSNPLDLSIAIAKGNNSSLYALAISRGPLHNFKLMLSTAPFAETVEEAIALIKAILETVIITAEGIPFGETVTTEANQKSFERIETVPGPVLDHSLIDWIVAELREHKTADTWSKGKT